ncbi:Imm70 family immunity protein [Enterococcus raffinosus]|uniref:Imm70 family immunity protein n=1 Tax=Enterococcus raffinosus TaxID=71452 RepID=UPI001C43E034|nr:Imm70 family immunity protein [Enterococcus raffinosus]MDT2572693.1 Imm70 family immunity protein [Enterococcus raffinosus]QXJ59614.1 hypothetical protein J9537_02130 [Enterococcus raffinosus]
MFLVSYRNRRFFPFVFSTICVNLEEMGWGSRFPIIMNDLYEGKLSKDKLKVARKEINGINSELSNFTPNKVVWDVEDLKKTPPWGKNISEDITNLAEYFVTTDGRYLLEVLMEAISEAIDKDVKIEITVL